MNWLVAFPSAFSVYLGLESQGTKRERPDSPLPGVWGHHCHRGSEYCCILRPILLFPNIHHRLAARMTAPILIPSKTCNVGFFAYRPTGLGSSARVGGLAKERAGVGCQQTTCSEVTADGRAKTSVPNEGSKQLHLVFTLKLVEKVHVCSLQIELLRKFNSYLG